MSMYRRFVSEEEYVKSFEDRGEVVPPFLVFQPYVVRNGISGYLVLCPRSHPDAEEFEPSNVVGLTEDETKLLIADMRVRMIKILDKWILENDTAELAEKVASEKRGCADYTKEKLLTMIKFLKVYSSASYDGWIAELSVEYDKEDLDELPIL